MYRNDKCVSAHFSCYCQASIPVSLPLPSPPFPHPLLLLSLLFSNEWISLSACCLSCPSPHPVLDLLPLLQESILYLYIFSKLNINVIFTRSYSYSLCDTCMLEKSSNFNCKMLKWLYKVWRRKIKQLWNKYEAPFFSFCFFKSQAALCHSINLTIEEAIEEYVKFWQICDVIVCSCASLCMASSFDALIMSIVYFVLI